MKKGMVINTTANHQEELNACKTIGVCDVFKELGISDSELLEMTWKEESALVMQYCSDNDYHYYGKPKGEYFKWEGIAQAVALGKSGVVLENLS